MMTNPEEEQEHPPEDGLDKAVRTRRERRELWERIGERSMGRNLAMIGALGWVIVAPTLIGVFAGRWLDQAFGSALFWTLGLMVAGLAIGLTLAWKRMHQE